MTVQRRYNLVLVATFLAWVAAMGNSVSAHAAGPLHVTWGPTTTPATMTVHTRIATDVVVTNSGSVSWGVGGPQPVYVGYRWYAKDGVMLASDGRLTALPAMVDVGQTITLAADVQSPPTPGSYILRFDLVQGSTWFSSVGSPTLDRSITVSAAPYDVSWSTATQPGMAARSSVQISVTTVNTGTQTWVAAQGANPVHLSYHWESADGTTAIIYEGVRSTLPADVSSGQSVTILATVRTPNDAGTYLLVFDLVAEGVAWFSSMNSPTLNLIVAVQRPALDVMWDSVPKTAGGQAHGQVVVPVALSNSGTAAWTAAGANPVHVSYHLFRADGTLVSWDGLRTALLADVPPGGSVTVNATVATPASTASYRVVWDLIQEGVVWFSDAGAQNGVTQLQVGPADHDVTWRTTPASLQLHARDAVQVMVTLSNSGVMVWRANGSSPVRLSYHWLDNRGRIMTWDGPRSALPNDVGPGQSVTVAASIRALSVQGDYRLVWDLVHEGSTWFSSAGAETAWTSVAVGKPLLEVGWRMLSAPPTAVPARGQFRLSVAITNDGAGTWPTTGRQPVRLAYHWQSPDGSVVVFDGRRTALASDVRPAETVDVSALVVAPEAPGRYRLVLDLVQEGVGWFSSTGARTLIRPLTATLPILEARWSDCSAPATMTAGGGALSLVMLTNIGAETWAADGPGALELSYHWMNASGTVVVQDGLRTLLPAPLPHGETATVQLGIFAPSEPGDYVLQCDAVIDSVGWLSNLGSATLKRSVHVLANTGDHGQRPVIKVLKPSSPIAAASPSGLGVMAPFAVLLCLPLGLGLLVGGWYVSRLWRRL